MPISTWIFVLEIFYCTVETAYFGWNFTPASEAELIADGISTIIASIGFLARIIERQTLAIK